MNTYTRNMNPGSQNADRTAAAGRMRFACFAARISLLILLIFFAIATQMHLRAEIERLNKRAARIQSNIHQLNVQCTNLRNRKETLTGWTNIHSKIRRYHLGLREADHRQISYITLEIPRAVRKTLRPVQAERRLKKLQEYAHSDR